MINQELHYITFTEIEKAADKLYGTDVVRANCFHNGANWAIGKLLNHAFWNQEVEKYLNSGQISIKDVVELENIVDAGERLTELYNLKNKSKITKETPEPRIRDAGFKDVIKNHPENLYRGGADPEIEKILKQMRKQPFEFYTPPPSRAYCLELAAKATYKTVGELLENADKIFNHLTK